MGIKIKKDRVDSQRRAVCFLASLLIHGTLIALLFSLKVSVRIDLELLEVRNALLVSPEQLFIPMDIEDSLRRLQETARDELGGESSRDKNIQDKAGVRGDQGRTSEPVKRGRASSTGRSDSQIPIEEEAFSAELASMFAQGVSFKSDSDLPPETILDLSLEVANTRKLLSETERDLLERYVKQLKYPRSGFFNIGFSKGDTGFTRQSVSGASQGARASILVEDYDLTPWAKEVVNTILKKWNIPYPKELGVKGVVGISVIIDESGEILSAQVVNSSFVLLLDEAALKALKESSPFPSLPRYFPEKSLSVLFEFYYDD